MTEDEEVVTKSWLKEFLSYLLKKEEQEIEVIKSLNEEQMVSVEVFYMPPGVVDAHGDTVKDVSVIKAYVKSFNHAVDDGRAKPCLFHKHLTKAYSYVKAYVTETPVKYGDEVLPEGTPLLILQWHNPKAWELRKKGVLCGGSLYGKARIANG